MIDFWNVFFFFIYLARFLCESEHTHTHMLIDIRITIFVSVKNIQTFCEKSGQPEPDQ